MKSLAFRTVSGVIAGSILLMLPGTAIAAVHEPVRPSPVPGPGDGATRRPVVNTGMGNNPALASVRKKHGKPARPMIDKATGRSAANAGASDSVEPAGSAPAGSPAGPVASAGAGSSAEPAGNSSADRPLESAVSRGAGGAIEGRVAGAPAAVDVSGGRASGTPAGASGVAEHRLPADGTVTGKGVPADGGDRRGRDLAFRVSVPGATASGVYATSSAPEETRRGVKGKGSPALTVSLKVTERTRCGVLQMTTNGPADGIEWYTFAALCKPGTATFRTEATRLPWSTGTLPSVRLCNGLSPALAEGDDCDTFDPPRGS